MKSEGLEVSSLVKFFGTTKAVDGVSFRIKPGEIYGLIGPNGAGKTTIVKIITGLYRKDSGRVELDGDDITADDSIKRVKIGYIPDEPVFYPYLTGREFLEYVRRIYAVGRETFYKKAKELIRKYSLSETLDDYPESYSRGSKQKLSIIAALSRKPEFLVVDEPIVGLDPRSTKVTNRLFADFSRKGGMVFISSHSLPFVEKSVDRIGVIDKGKLIFEGKVEEFMLKGKREKEDFEAAFIRLTG